MKISVDIERAIREMDMIDLRDVLHLAQSEMKRRVGEIGDVLTDEEKALIASNNLIGCVKSIRERTGLGLAESKRLMDNARDRGGL